MIYCTGSKGTNGKGPFLISRKRELVEPMPVQDVEREETGHFFGSDLTERRRFDALSLTTTLLFGHVVHL